MASSSNTLCLGEKDSVVFMESRIVSRIPTLNNQLYIPPGISSKETSDLG